MGSKYLGTVLDECGYKVAKDMDGLCEAIENMHSLSDDYDEDTLKAAKDIVEEWEITKV